MALWPVGWTEHWVAKVCTRYNAICSLAICIQICKFDPDCNLLLVLLGLMMMKSSKKWLTMSWLAEFLVGLLWSNLPLMTCYLRSCLSSIWAKKNLLPLALPAVKLVWKSEFFNWKKILPPFCLNLEPNFVKSASFNHSQLITEEDEQK